MESERSSCPQVFALKLQIQSWQCVACKASSRTGPVVIAVSALIARLLGIPALAGSSPALHNVVDAQTYARAESFLPANTEPLVFNSPNEPVWDTDRSFHYQIRTAAGTQEVTIAVPAGSRTVKWVTGASPSQPTNDSNVSLSPDGRQAAFIRDNNLWVRDIGSGAETQLTTDGLVDFGYATDNAGWKHTPHPILLWSPDSRRIATFQQDQRRVAEMYLLSTQPGHPRLERWKYAMASDAEIPMIQRVIIDVPTRKVVRLDIPPDPHRSTGCYDVECGDGKLADAQWNPQGTQLAFISSSRDHKVARLRLADAATGSVREVLQETATNYYESDISQSNLAAVNWRYLPASHEVIWYSARDDWAHLYLYDIDSGRLKHRITTGAWNVLDVRRVDEKRRLIYFLGAGREPGLPYFVHLYKIGFDGRGLQLLTPENATHETTFSPSGRYFVDRYSGPDAPPVTVLRDRNGKLLAHLETADVSRLRNKGWQPPQIITVKARDGTTDLYGLLFRPASFDPKRRYPIVNRIYPGPQMGSVNLWTDKQQWHFDPSRDDAQALAELGFIVVEINGLGTDLRSRHFHDYDYGNMGDNTLPDQVTGMRQLAARYPWIDLGRAGIYGHSGGGYAAAAALFRYPDFFKVGVSESGNHDQAGYTDDWGDKFQGLFERGADGTSNYDSQANQRWVRGLKGHLLLAQGTVDDNVPPNLTLLLVDALIKANKDFDLLMLPNQPHTYGGEAQSYMTRRRWDYFVRYLLEAEPPQEYRIGGTPPAANP